MINKGKTSFYENNVQVNQPVPFEIKETVNSMSFKSMGSHKKPFRILPRQEDSAIGKLSYISNHRRAYNELERG